MVTLPLAFETALQRGRRQIGGKLADIRRGETQARGERVFLPIGKIGGQQVIAVHVEAVAGAGDFDLFELHVGLIGGDGQLGSHRSCSRRKRSPSMLTASRVFSPSQKGFGGGGGALGAGGGAVAFGGSVLAASTREIERGDARPLRR